MMQNSTTVKDVSWLTFKVEARYSIRNFRDRCLMHREQPCSIFIRSKKEKKEKKRPAGVRPNSTDLIRYRSSMLERRRPHSASCPLFAVSRGERRYKYIDDKFAEGPRGVKMPHAKYRERIGR